MFQFLIGRLDTGDETRVSLIERLFQFLIGRLDTATRSNNAATTFVFQFLIGRLDTRQRLALRQFVVVSIPHR